MTESYDPYAAPSSAGARQPGEILIDDSRLPVDAPPTGDSAAGSDDVGTADRAKEQAREVAETATEAGARVAGAVKDEVAGVTAAAGRQAKDLLGQTRGEITAQLGEQQRRVAGGLRSLTAELGSMADSTEQPGLASDLVTQAADRVDTLATWLEQREPGGVLDEVKSFARERPGTFLALAAGAGLLAGRLTRGLVADAKSESGGTSPEPTSHQNDIGGHGDAMHRAEPLAPAAAPATYAPPSAAGGLGNLA